MHTSRLLFLAAGLIALLALAVGCGHPKKKTDTARAGSSTESTQTAPPSDVAADDPDLKSAETKPVNTIDAPAEEEARPLQAMLSLRGYCDLSQDDSFLYGRLQFNLWQGRLWNDEADNLTLRPYAELYYNLDTDLAERTQAGVELVWDAARFATLSVGAHYAMLSFDESRSLSEAKQSRLLGAPNSWEARAALELHAPIRWGPFRDRPLEFYIRDDFTYNLSEGRNTYNSPSLGFRYDVNERVTLEIGWRHDDITHSHDSDDLFLGFHVKF